MTDETHVHFKITRAGCKRLKGGKQPTPAPTPPLKRVPRIARLMALAIHFDVLIRKGAIRDYAELARLGGLTRARITQIMNLLNLAPEIQERLLFLPGTVNGRDSISERELRAICNSTFWQEQSNTACLVGKRRTVGASRMP